MRYGLEKRSLAQAPLQGAKNKAWSFGPGYLLFHLSPEQQGRKTGLKTPGKGPRGPSLQGMKKMKKTKLLDFYRKMVEIRSFEERIRFLFLEGKMPGTIHQYIGMEACAVGVCSALKKEDVIASTHRPHGHAIARGLSFNELMAELLWM